MTAPIKRYKPVIRKLSRGATTPGSEAVDDGPFVTYNDHVAAVEAAVKAESEACFEAVQGEHLNCYQTLSAEREDVAYDQAVNDCGEAIRARSRPLGAELPSDQAGYTQFHAAYFGDAGGPL